VRRYDPIGTRDRCGPNRRAPRTPAPAAERTGTAGRKGFAGRARTAGVTDDERESSRDAGSDHDPGPGRESEPELLARTEAVKRVRTLRGRLPEEPVERIGLDRIAGRTLAEPVVAERDLPPRSEATMDGVALAADAALPLRIVDDVLPEDDPPEVGPGEAARIATGAPLPAGTDAVVMREHATVEGGRLTGVDAGAVEPGRHVYERGTNAAADETLFRAGERLAPKDAALLADLGRETIPVRTRPGAGVLATGTEIHEGTTPDRDSAMLAGLVRRWGGEATLAGSVPDDYDRIETRVDALAADHDVVLTTGGTSVGREDHAVRALRTLGEIRVRGVRLRPGRPVTVAVLPDHDAVAVAIPGKPVAALAAALAVLRPLFVGANAAAGDHPRPAPTVGATLSRDVGVPGENYEYWVPVVLESSAEGTEGAEADPDAMPLGHVDSPLSIYEGRFAAGRIASTTRATRADGFVALETDAAAGDPVRVVPFPTLE